MSNNPMAHSKAFELCSEADERGPGVSKATGHSMYPDPSVTQQLLQNPASTNDSMPRHDTSTMGHPPRHDTQGLSSAGIATSGSAGVPEKFPPLSALIHKNWQTHRLPSIRGVPLIDDSPSPTLPIIGNSVGASEPDHRAVGDEEEAGNTRTEMNEVADATDMAAVPGCRRVTGFEENTAESAFIQAQAMAVAPLIKLENRGDDQTKIARAPVQRDRRLPEGSGTTAGRRGRFAIGLHNAPHVLNGISQGYVSAQDVGASARSETTVTRPGHIVMELSNAPPVFRGSGITNGSFDRIIAGDRADLPTLKGFPDTDSSAVVPEHPGATATFDLPPNVRTRPIHHTDLPVYEVPMARYVARPGVARTRSVDLKILSAIDGSFDKYPRGPDFEQEHSEEYRKGFGDCLNVVLNSVNSTESMGANGELERPASSSDVVEASARQRVSPEREAAVVVQRLRDPHIERDPRGPTLLSEEAFELLNGFPNFSDKFGDIRTKASIRAPIVVHLAGDPPAIVAQPSRFAPQVQGGAFEQKNAPPTKAVKPASPTLPLSSSRPSKNNGTAERTPQPLGARSVLKIKKEDESPPRTAAGSGIRGLQPPKQIQGLYPIPKTGTNGKLVGFSEAQAAAMTFTGFSDTQSTMDVATNVVYGDGNDEYEDKNNEDGYENNKDHNNDDGNEDDGNENNGNGDNGNEDVVDEDDGNEDVGNEDDGNDEISGPQPGLTTIVAPAALAAPPAALAAPPAPPAAAAPAGSPVTRQHMSLPDRALLYTAYLHNWTYKEMSERIVLESDRTRDQIKQHFTYRKRSGDIGPKGKNQKDRRWVTLEMCREVGVQGPFHRQGGKLWAVEIEEE